MEECTRRVFLLLHAIPKGYGEEELWFEFKKLGDVRGFDYRLGLGIMLRGLRVSVLE